jgi:hypothetical protein
LSRWLDRRGGTGFVGSTHAKHRVEQAMTDPYRIGGTSDTPQAIRSHRERGSIMRPVLWVLLVISGACNVVTSSMNIPVLIGIAFGLLTLACGAALVVDHYRRRRR